MNVLQKMAAGSLRDIVEKVGMLGVFEYWCEGHAWTLSTLHTSNQLQILSPLQL